MAETAITPSEEKPITEGEIGKINELVAAKLRKSNLPSGLVQEILKTRGGELADNFVKDLQDMVDTVSNLIIRKVPVNRSLTGPEAIQATGRKQYVSNEVVATMPEGEGDEAEVIFFNLGHYVSDDDLDKEYKDRGLVPTDPFSLAAVNEADPEFADDHPNGTHWKDANGNWCYIAFNRWHGERIVNVSRNVRRWDDYWWFAGRRK